MLPVIYKVFLSAGEIDMSKFEASVQAIAHEVKSQGNQGIFACTARYDGAPINEDNFLVSEQEIEEARAEVDGDYIISLRKAIENIMAFHRKQLKTSWMEPDAKGNILGQLYRPPPPGWHLCARWNCGLSVFGLNERYSGTGSRRRRDSYGKPS